MISEAADSIASLIWACANGNEDAMKELKKAVSDGMLCNADNALTALATYIADVKVKADELEELKSNARDANNQWDKFTLKHNIAGQSQLVFGDTRALYDDGCVDVEHMFTAVKKAYTDMLDVISYVMDYATKNHMLMQALGIEMCFILTHESLNVADMAGVKGNTAIILGTNEFKHIAGELILDDAGDAEDNEEDDVE